MITITTTTTPTCTRSKIKYRRKSPEYFNMTLDSSKFSIRSLQFTISQIPIIQSTSYLEFFKIFKSRFHCQIFQIDLDIFVDIFSFEILDLRFQHVKIVKYKVVSCLVVIMLCLRTDGILDKYNRGDERETNTADINKTTKHVHNSDGIRMRNIICVVYYYGSFI